MQTEYVARGLRIDSKTRDLTGHKLDKLATFLQEPISAHVALSVQKRRHRAEIHVTHRHGSLQASEETEDTQSSIHLVFDKLDKQARRSAKKFQTNRRRAARHVQEDEFWSHEVLRGGTGAENSGPRIVESKRVRVKPMTVDEAALELQASAHSEFVVFREVDRDSVSVLYRRKDGDYGLISPER